MRPPHGAFTSRQLRWLAASLVAILVVAVALRSTRPTRREPYTPPVDLAHEAPPNLASAANSFTDPFAYCEAVGTLDAPDGRYAGPSNTPAMAKGYADAAGYAPDSQFRRYPPALTWRCAEGHLLVCSWANNIPCGKADTNRQPTAEMVAFCQDPPSTFAIVPYLPAAVTGHDTVFLWTCTDGRPNVVGQEWDVDAQGYITRFWYQVGD